MLYVTAHVSGQIMKSGTLSCALNGWIFPINGFARTDRDPFSRNRAYKLNAFHCLTGTLKELVLGFHQ